MHDLVIRNGKIIDGSGDPAVIGDIAVDGQTIISVGGTAGPGKTEIDAEGLLVTPGFVDIHTHYDGQATWDSLLTPSVYHGVTTVVMGNCGVGFAPVKPGQQDWLIRLMEGVEDIPGTALAEGIDWQWESFPEFLDTLESKSHTIDIAAQLPHAALRTYVMGKRGGDHQEIPSDSEITEMARLTKEAVEAGAIGFTTSRTVNHKSADGEPTPSLTATAKELWGIAEGLKQANKGVIQLVCDFEDHDAEFELIQQMAARSGRPASITINQLPNKPDEWRRSLKMISEANEQGIQLKAQVAPRPVGIILSLQSTYHPFVMCPSYQEIVGKSLEEKVQRLQDPEFKKQLLDEWKGHSLFEMEQIWVLNDPPVYEPDSGDSIHALAKLADISPSAYALNVMLGDEGQGMLYYPALNFSAGNSDVSREMLVHPHTVPGLGDGGAHVSFISDVSFPTYLLTHWGRDRPRGDLIPLEYLIKSQTQDTASVVGFHDRGLLAPGMKADVNIIDYDELYLEKPTIIKDLPAGGKRLMQKTRGYKQMIVSGQVVMENGQPTGLQPGKLVRGQQPAPNQ